MGADYALPTSRPHAQMRRWPEVFVLKAPIAIVVVYPGAWRGPGSVALINITSPKGHSMRRLLASAVLLLSPAFPGAADFTLDDQYFAKELGAPSGTGYTVGFDLLYRIELGTGQRTEIGQIRDDNFVYSNIEGLAISPDGVLYGVTDFQFKALLRIDTQTARAVRVGNLGIAGQGVGPSDQFDFGLAFTCDGRLWMTSDATRQLWEVNPGSGAASLVGDTGAPITGLAGRNSQLFGLGGKGDRNLYRVSRNTAAATVIGPVKPPGGSAWSQGGLDFDRDGVLWATLDYVPNELRAADILRIDLATGAGTLTATLPLVENTGARALAMAPPPCTAGVDPVGDPVLPEPRPVPASGLFGQILLVLLLGIAGLLAITLTRR
jgi:hypothetical protein